MATARATTRATTRTAATPAVFIGARSGASYKLGQEIGAGGNGIVFTVSLRPELVAKISRSALSQTDVDKLDAMVIGTTPDLVSVAAWPIDTLRNDHGVVIGFAMPRIQEARPLHELYSPRPRVQHFPAADFRFLVHVAANVARLFAAVHKAGFICGDVNHSNILVRQNGTVAAVDCDSFQVGDGARFPCLVGTEGFVPPELLGAALGSTPRTANHDDYGLALLIFHLLFMGRHPFAGRFLGRGEMPLERAVTEGRFAYSRDSRRTEMAPPPFTLPIDAVGGQVFALFERAFHPDGRRGGRPSPEMWIDALEALKASLAPCEKVAWHHHPRAMNSCPWCAIEGPTKVRLFGGLIRAVTTGIADLDALWTRYLALIAPPPQLPEAPRFVRPAPIRWAMLAPQPRKAAKRTLLSGLRQAIAGRLTGLLVWSAILLANLFNPGFRELMQWLVGDRLKAIRQVLAPYAAEIAELLAGVADTEPGAPILAVTAVPLAVSFLCSLGASGPSLIADAVRLPRRLAEWGRAVAQWRARRAAWRKAIAAAASLPPAPDLSVLQPPIEQLRKDIDALAAEREARLQAAAQPVPEDEQRARHLGQFRIEAAKLPGIGPARCAVLRSWGIDTAADIDEERIAEIPGFGKSLTDKVVLWRERQEAGFVPASTGTVDPMEILRIDRQIAARRAALMKELRQKIAELEVRMGEFTKARTELLAGVEPRSS